MEQRRLSGCFLSDTAFNMSRKGLTDTQVKVLEKRSKLCNNTEEMN